MDSFEQVLIKARKIKLVIFDVDGVLTDGSIFITDTGKENKIFYVHDGLGIKLLQETGVAVGIISSRTSQAVEHRMHDLGVIHVYQGQIQKQTALETLLKKLHLSIEEVAYVGDDLPDLPLISCVGLGITVPNAHALVLQAAHWQTTAFGGKGAAREVCELIMQAQGTFADIHKKF